MANVLSIGKQTAIIAALAEGSSIRSIERITGAHRDTTMRLGVRVGKGCEILMDSKMQDLGCNYLQLDELWGFIGKKERHCSVDDNPEYGDVWTFCAIDSETKLRHLTVLHLHPISTRRSKSRNHARGEKPWHRRKLKSEDLSYRRAKQRARSSLYASHWTS